jgi:hypothetical protein
VPSELDRLGCELATCVAGIDRLPRLDQKHVRFLVCLGAMLDAPRDNEHLALRQLDVAVAKLDGHPSGQDEKEVVGVLVLVPDELALDLDDANVVLVDPGDDLRLPVLSEAG